jgi:hypothetical protein
MTIAMSRHPFRIAIAATLYTLGVGWIVDTNPWSGPTLVSFTATHGVHTNDWVTFALWGVAVVTMFPTLSPVSRLRSSHVVEGLD